MFVFAHEFNILLPPHRTVRKLHLVQLVRVLGVPIPYSHAAAPVLQTEHKVRPILQHIDAALLQPLAEPQTVRSLIVMIVRAVVYRVVTVALVVYIRIIPITALEMVVTGSPTRRSSPL